MTAWKVCPGCRGSGVVVNRRHVVARCRVCNGGRVVRAADDEQEVSHGDS